MRRFAITFLAIGLGLAGSSHARTLMWIRAVGGYSQSEIEGIRQRKISYGGDFGIALAGRFGLGLNFLRSPKETVQAGLQSLTTRTDIYGIGLPVLLGGRFFQLVPLAGLARSIVELEGPVTERISKTVFTPGLELNSSIPFSRSLYLGIEGSARYILSERRYVLFTGLATLVLWLDF